MKISKFRENIVIIPVSVENKAKDINDMTGLALYGLTSTTMAIVMTTMAMVIMMMTKTC